MTMNACRIPNSRASSPRRLLPPASQMMRGVVSNRKSSIGSSRSIALSLRGPRIGVSLCGSGRDRGGSFQPKHLADLVGSCNTMAQLLQHIADLPTWSALLAASLPRSIIRLSSSPTRTFPPKITPIVPSGN